MTAKLPSRTRKRLVELGESIRLARREKGISRNQVAEMIGMHPQNYARIERGTKNVTFDTLLRVADGLGLELTIQLAAPPASRRKRKTT